MSPSRLLEWQWSGYASYHAARSNLLLHIVAVPIFMAGSLLLLAGAINTSLVLAGAGGAAMVISMVVQGRGHALEHLLPEPFTGLVNMLSRILLEQWVTFPRFVLSGGWARAFRKAA